MRKISRQVLAMLCVAALLLGGILPGTGVMTASAAGEHTLWLVGDSTVCSFSDSYYYPRYGYGTQIGNYLTADWTVQNLAMSGRSSKSFLGETNYETLKAGIKAGDVLVIGFGHNDEKAEPDRYTDPNGDYQTAGSFAESLYTNYVKMAKDKGAEAILCTPIVRRNGSGTLSDANCHITKEAVVNGVTYPGGDYAKAIRDLGAATSTPVVDLTAQTKALYESIGAEGTLKLHAWTGMKETSVDDTHLNIYGAKKVAYMLTSDVKAQGVTALAAGIDLSKGEPTEAERVPNPDYKEPDYSSDLAASVLWPDYKATLADGKTITFKGTVFGGMGGASKVGWANQALEPDKDGNMHVAALNGQGKIASKEDGFAMYYYRLPAGVPFTFTATAKVNSFGGTNETLASQCAFGLTARDDMYIDKGGDKSILSDYVVAGSVANSNCFYRKDTSLHAGPALSTNVAKDQSYDLSIVYNGDGYACTFGNEPAQSGGYDFQLTSVDPDYVYIGLFASRNVDVTYSNINLVVEGELPAEEARATRVYLAGDSTVKDYSAKGMYNKGVAEALGSWGEFLGNYFDSSKVAVTSFANGGRSSRSFLNEGKLTDLGRTLGEGDYLLIQFGHNDASDSAENKAERYVPLGTPDANGVYPSTPGAVGADGTYTWDCGGTYKWFLQQYIDLAKAKGATPILVTPVSRMYYTADGAIRPHHDAESTAEAEMTNSYVTAVKQLAQEQKVLLIDGFELTKALFEDAYKAGGNDTNGQQLMGVKATETGTEADTTHSNKLGGMIEAALMATAIKDLNLDISAAVKAPAAVTGATPDGKTAFTVSDAGIFTAYDSLSGYANEAAYWSKVGQKLLAGLPGGVDVPGGDEPAGDVTITAGGWLETAYAELKGVKAADVTAVSYSGAMAGALGENDLAYLVRDVDGVVRIDIPGLKAGTYDLSVTAGGKDYTATGVKVEAHDRSGFAHYNYTEGVGAYNDDGTLKDNAIVLYVTDENKNEVTLSSKDEYREMTVTGIGNILNSNNSKVNLFLLRAIALHEKKPLVVRFIGTVTKPEGVSAFKQGSSNGGMAYMLSGANITLEGIGPDATIQGWGISFGADKNDAKEGLAKNFEVRNLTFKEVPEDCVEITGRMDNGVLIPAHHTWVHNCAFYRPSDIANPAESDKKQGDGSLDLKFGEYMTSSYHYIERNHSSSLIGGAVDNHHYHVTWHHNYWKVVVSRAPLARQADMHIYNNLYEGQKSYCMSLRANTYIFSEYNTFINCKDVAIDEGSGGVCKSYMDTITDCTGRDASIKVTDKTQKVESANKFANFDTDPESYVAKGAYKLDTSVEAAQANIKAYGGPMKALPADEPDKPSGELAGTVVILHSNDVHGAVEGYAKMDTLKKEYEAKGADVLVVDAGDFSQGETSVSVSQGATAIELMNMVGYAAAAPGNHEFDYGYANLKTLAEKATFPILAANVKYNDANAFGDHVVLTTASGAKVGLFGLDTPETASKAHPAKIAGVKFAGGEEMYAVAQAEVDALKAAGADYIICLGHLGIDDETAATANRSIDLLAKVTGIDVFVDGHSHSTLEDIVAVTNAERKVGDTVVTSTGTKFANIGVITLKDGVITTECVSTEGITVAEDNAIAARAAAIRAEIDAEYGAVFAKSEVELNGNKAPGNRTQETNNGDLITDAILWLATKEELSVPKENVVALTNGGGIRAAIKVGDVTKKDVNTVLPFGNTVAVDYVTGKVLLEALEASTFCTPDAIGGFPQVAGIKFTVDTTKTYDQGDLYPGTTYYAPKTINRVTIDSINGKAFDENATYAVVTNDFVAAGGDTYYALSTSETITDTGVPLDEAVMQYITEELGGVISAAKYGEPQGRITVKTEAEQPSKPTHRPSGNRGDRGETTTPEDNGNKVSKTNKNGDVTVTVTDKDGEKLVNITVPATIPAPETKFVDVPEGHWAETAINNMAGLGVVNGVGEGAYDMTSSVTRGSIATILFRFGGGAEGKTSTFADVAAGQWYTDAIGWAADTGVVTGYSATEFGPNDTITRQQLAVMLARFAKLIGMDTDADKAALDSFTDGSAVDSWAEDGMAWCVEQKVLQGKSAEVLDPTAQVTRAEAAVMFDRFIALIK